MGGESDQVYKWLEVVIGFEGRSLMWVMSMQVFVLVTGVRGDFLMWVMNMWVTVLVDWGGDRGEG